METLLRQRMRGLRSASFQLPCEEDVLPSAFEDKPLCVPRQLAELLQLSVEEALSLEGVFQMDSILPERLPAFVRPAFDLVLRRIRSLTRCAQACGCKIMTPRYACNLAPGCISSEPTFAGLRKNQKKRKKGPKKRGPRKKGKRGFLLAKVDIA